MKNFFSAILSFFKAEVKQLSPAAKQLVAETVQNEVQMVVPEIQAHLEAKTAALIEQKLGDVQWSLKPKA